jgi:flagellar basal-body rod protein FlgG
VNRALYAAAGGMAEQQARLEIIAENLANADVAGFKGSSPVQSGKRTIFTQGKLMRSDGPLDLAIDGPGFFEMTDARGRVAYTRDGEFSRAADGTVRNASGWRLAGVHIPQDALAVSVAQDGTVTATTAHGSRRCGRVRLVVFCAPDFLRTQDGVLFFATAASGKPQTIDPGGADAPAVRFGTLEKSNVTIIEAMMQILGAQRAYEANAKGVQAADDMMRIADNLSRE